ncbi:MAG: hypothetical protein HY652_14655 [Acidobacteria bacterium]|nr:hypothetical protein [Acidobacteriota bacterium]
MSKKNFERQVSDLVNAVHLCFDRGLILPGLTLLYAAIDAMAWLSKPKETDPVGESFQDWVKAYLLTSYKGEFGTPDQLALDLYVARCAVLHAQIAESDLSKKAKAREVHYRLADGTGLVPVEGFNAALLNIYVDPVALQKWFVAAIETFKWAIASDSDLRARVYERAAKYFVPVTIRG